LHFFLFKFTQENFRNFITKWVVADDQPFTTLESKHFRQMIKLLSLDAFVPSGDTIKNDILESFKDEQERMKKLFQVILNIYINVVIFKNIYLLYIV
jgi:hypothetical protein